MTNFIFPLKLNFKNSLKKRRSIDEDDDRSFKKSNKTDKKDRIKTTLFPIDAVSYF